MNKIDKITEPLRYPYLYNAMIEKGFSPTSLSLKSGFSRGYVADIQSGEIQNPSHARLKSLADTLKVTLNRILYGVDEKQPLIVASLWAGGKIIYLENYVNSTGEVITLPDIDSPADHIAVGESIPITIEEGWQIKIGKKYIGAEIEAKCLDKVCALRLVGGDTLYMKVKRGSQPGKYHLLGHGKLLENVEIKWCAKVEAISPA